MEFNSGYREELVYGAKFQGVRKREAAGTPLFENMPPEVVKNSEPLKEPAAGAANQNFPDYEPFSGKDSEEDTMVSLEDPYPCRFSSVASLSMGTRACKESVRRASEEPCCAYSSPFHCMFWL